MSWLDLFCKFEFEFFLGSFRELVTVDFSQIYRILESCGPRIKTLFLTLHPSRYCKSGQYWIQSVLSNLPNLENLIVQDDDSIRYGVVWNKTMTYLKKGLNNHRENGGSIKSLYFKISTINDNDIFGHILKTLPDIEILKFDTVTFN